MAEQRRAAYSGEEYWGRPLPGFGDHAARLAVVGLAPAAHGGNRTGRIFTGDRSGDWLWAALWRAGLANQPGSVSRDDGLQAIGVWVTATVRCAPPQNRPTPQERDNCLPYLQRELDLLPGVSVLLALGGFAYEACCRLLGIRRRPPFGHGVEVAAEGGRPSSVRTTPASKTRSPAGSPNRCSTPSSLAPGRWREGRHDPDATTWTLISEVRWPTRIIEA